VTDLSLTPDSRFSRSPRVRSAQVGDERVLLHLDAGHYFSLNATAGWVWDRLVQPQTLEELAEGLTSTFEIDLATAREDLAALVRELLGERLVELRERSGEDPGSASVPPAPLARA
jgi:hypothetical protein